MPAELVLYRDSELYRTLHDAVSHQRCIFVAGLPGVGKSLIVQQLALLAGEAGRAVHLLQWDVARRGFERPEILARYPEVDNVTHAAIRKAVGLWAREAVRRWDREHPESLHLLIGETPFVGNRLIELAQPRDDAVEPLLASERTLFVIRAPSREVRQTIEASRAREMASPRHERETANAPPRLVDRLWLEIAEVARRLALARPASGADYDPDVYVAVYQRLLRHRHARPVPITEVLPVSASAYDLPTIAGELVPTPEDVERFMAQVEAMSEPELHDQVERWYEGL
jgi:hypothetical protein